MIKGKKRKERKGRAPSNTDSFDFVRKGHLAEGHPHLSLRHLQRGFGVEEMDERQRSQFLLKWAKRSMFTWDELGRHSKHGLGFEKIRKHQIKPRVPEEMSEQVYLVFRHDGNLPFVGFKAADTFYVLWIEARYGDLYDRG